ncbi:putative effector protein [Ceratobasidium theobromae]|uniref:Putative effector protein n=1 Tax=Ceratobasidium theobromae TaxID=1582974 RepID=A0A5N5QC18_9AGAM|nr:putative effector protein [Ceratobasidium theobromae]
MRLALILASFFSLAATTVVAKEKNFVYAAHWSPKNKCEVKPNRIVSVNPNDPLDFCLILPLKPHVNIPDSETDNGAMTYCSGKAFSDPSQRRLPDKFFSHVDVRQGAGKNKKKYVQMTGCFRREKFGFNDDDEGGQYDNGSKGHPKCSKCVGFDHYVSLIEPAENRACLRCCEDPADCPTNMDTQGCEAVIPGNYFDCN